MNKRTQLEREKLLFRYSTALERGDFETVSAILRAAQDDPTLARMIDEINAVYQAETALQPIRPSLHSNNNHATKRGDTMQTTYPMQPDLLNQSTPKGIRRWYSAPLIAAALAMVILGGLLLSSKPSGLPGTGGNNGDNGAQVVDTTLSTPTHIPLTPIPTLNTPVPVTSATPVFIASPVPLQAGLTVEAFASPGVLCTGMIDPNPQVEGVNLFSRPSVNGLVTTRLPGGTGVEILEQIPVAWGEAVEWYFVSALLNNQSIQGWVSAEGVIFNMPCPALSTPTLVPTPTALFDGAFNLGGYPLVLLQPFGNIPAGTAVRISSTWFDQNVGQRYYDVVDEADNYAGGVPEQYLSYAPGITMLQPSPVMLVSVTPTSTPFGMGTATFTPTPAASHTTTPIPAS